MGFENEMAIEITIQGLTLHEVKDFEGELIGSFSNYASAMGAQRDFNIKKMTIKKAAVLHTGESTFACEFETTANERFTAYVGKNMAGYWFGADADPNRITERIAANPSYGG